MKNSQTGKKIASFFDRLELGMITYLWALVAGPLVFFAGSKKVEWVEANYQWLGLVMIAITALMGLVFYAIDSNPTADEPGETKGQGRKKDFTWLVIIPIICSAAWYFFVLIDFA